MLYSKPLSLAALLMTSSLLHRHRETVSQLCSHQLLLLLLLPMPTSWLAIIITVVFPATIFNLFFSLMVAGAITTSAAEAEAAAAVASALYPLYMNVMTLCCCSLLYKTVIISFSQFLFIFSVFSLKLYHSRCVVPLLHQVHPLTHLRNVCRRQ